MEKYLVIDMRDGGDWSLDLLFAGLVLNQGPENVDMFPYKQKHVEWETLTERSWNLERRSLGYTTLNRSVPRKTEAEIKAACLKNEYDFVFLDEREESFLQYLKLGLNYTKTKVVVVAGHDKFWNHSPDFVSKLYGKNFHMMFLDNWKPEYDTLPWAKLINWSTNFDHFWDPSKRDGLLKDKKYDVCFLGYASHPARTVVIDFVEKNFGHLNNYILFERKPDTIENFLLKSEYFPIMAQSKICLNLAGAAVDGRALRFYEIPYVGSFMLTQKTKAKQLDPFVHGTHCMYFDTLDELEQMVKSMLRYDEIRENMASAGHRLSLEKHSVKRRVEYVLGEIHFGP
jgi:hypothetical protein